MAGLQDCRVFVVFRFLGFRGSCFRLHKFEKLDWLVVMGLRKSLCGNNARCVTNSADAFVRSSVPSVRSLRTDALRERNDGRLFHPNRA